MEELKRDTNIEYITRLYRYMRHGTSVEDFMLKYHIKSTELKGLLELCRIYGKNIDIIEKNGTLIFDKPTTRTFITTKPDLTGEKLIHTEICVVSDTHLGNIHQQLHLLNQIYLEAYNRGITDIFHIGDICDGDYSRVRPIHVHEVFLYGATGQLDYTVKTLPKYPGMKWKIITGSHDQTHLFNYGMDLGKELAKRRPDIEYLGQDRGYHYYDNCKIELFHPGGGASRILSSISQNGIDQIPSKTKPNLQLRGHYHKVYYMLYRNIHMFLCPCNVDQSSFMMKNEIPNLMGNYFITIWYDDNGDIQYIKNEPMIFDPQDVRKNDWENPKKYIRNKIYTRKK